MPAPDTTPARPLAVITGASGGIGLELARVAAADGHDLVLVARRSAALQELAAELTTSTGVDVVTVAADLGSEEGVETVLAALAGRTVDVLVNNAGVGGAGLFATERALEADLAMIALNVTALVRLTGELLPAMVARGSGRVLNLGSTAGYLPGPLQAVYYATKAFVRSFSEALAEETRGTGVTVTVVSPGPVDTGFAAEAGLGESLLMKYPLAKVPAADVARQGWQAMQAGRRELVPGLLMRATMPALRLVPRPLAARMARAMNH